MELPLDPVYTELYPYSNEGILMEQNIIWGLKG